MVEGRVLALACCVLFAHTAGHEPTVQLPSGAQLQGISQSAAHQFLGIPYAHPPVGSRRFVLPTEYILPAGPFDATAFGAACIQLSASVKPQKPSEDCLFLNVFVPASPSTNSTGLPTLFFIHGQQRVDVLCRVRSCSLDLRGPIVYMCSLHNYVLSA